MATPRLEMLPNREPLSRSKNSNIRATIAISLGATAGGLSRYYLGLWLTQSINTGFPLGILVVNISGCFFIGIITTLAADYYLLTPT